MSIYYKHVTSNLQYHTQINVWFRLIPNTLMFTYYQGTVKESVENNYS